jgi:hypothetical protein
MRRIVLVSVAFASFVFAQSGSAQGWSPVEGAPVQAIWKQQEVSFYYQSFTTFYSCSSLENKIRRVLTAVGADRDMKLRSRGCLSPNEISRMPFVEIELVSPVVATAEELAELEKTRSTRELAARVRGDSKQAQLAEAQFLANWKQVSLSRGSKLRLEPGDCELIEQLKERVFPKLNIRIVEDQVRCVPNQVSSNQPKLVVEALFELPKPDEAVDSEQSSKD